VVQKDLAQPAITQFTGRTPTQPKSLVVPIAGARE
jgi:hypothetical protein